MSIILDALKKAEKDRSGKDGKPDDAAPVNVVVPDAPKSQAKALLLVLVLALALGGGLYAWRNVYKAKQTTTAASPLVPKPINASKSAAPDPERLEKMRSQALLHFDEGRDEESLKIWTKLTETAPEDAEAFNNRGVVEKKMGKMTEARTSYERAIELKPDYPQALNNQGVLLAESGYAPEAREFFLKAIAADETYPEPHYHLAILDEKGGRATEALGHYESFLAASGDRIDPALKNKVNMRIAVMRARVGASQ